MRDSVISGFSELVKGIFVRFIRYDPQRFVIIDRIVISQCKTYESWVLRVCLWIQRV
jgi:hypothetical protein